MSTASNAAPKSVSADPYQAELDAVISAYQADDILYDEAKARVFKALDAHQKNFMVFLPSAMNLLTRAHHVKIDEVRKSLGRGHITGEEAVDQTLAQINEPAREDIARVEGYEQMKKLVLKPKAMAEGHYEITAQNIRADVKLYDAARGLTGALAAHFYQSSSSEKEFPQIQRLLELAHKRGEAPAEDIAYALLDASERLVREKENNKASDWYHSHPMRRQAQAAIKRLFEVAAVSEEPQQVLLREVRVLGLQHLTEKDREGFREKHEPVIRHCITMVAKDRDSTGFVRNALGRAARLVGNEDAEVPHDWVMQNGTTPAKVYEELLLAKA